MTNTPISELPITFVIPGIRRAGVSRGGGVVNGLPSLEGLVGELKGSVQVERRRAGGEAHRIQAQPGEDVVVLHLDQGPPLVLHPSTARDLLLAQSTKQRAVSRGSGGVTELELGPQEVEVSPQLGWNGMESAALGNSGAKRGGLGDVVLKVIEVVGLKGRAEELVARKLAEQLDDRVNEGVYALQPERLTPLRDKSPVQTMETAKPGAAVLVFVHGTFSTTADTALVNNAVNMAVDNRTRSGPTILHADHGTQFTSWSFGENMRRWDLLGSFGTVGDCFDNAAMEAFWARLQVELLNTRRWATTIELAAAMADYIDNVYNVERRHSYLGNISPTEFETLWTSTYSISQLA
jgi:hypothetical protein